MILVTFPEKSKEKERERERDDTTPRHKVCLSYVILFQNRGK